jgi:Protein of unknown function (DUF2490)
MQSRIVLCCCLLSTTLPAQQGNPENDRTTGLWFDQEISAALAPGRSLVFQFHQRVDNGATNPFAYFFQAGIAFVLRPGITVIPSYRYRSHPGSSTGHENRLLLDLTLSKSSGWWQPQLRTITEGRFQENRVASARFRLRPGIDYHLPIRWTRPPIAVVNNEFFLVPNANRSASGSSFSQNRFQVGIRLPIADSCSVHPYFMLRSAHQPTGWDTTRVFGLMIAFRF